MDYHLNRKLRLLSHPDKSLYSWAINEVDDAGNVVGYDQIPWPWTLYFTATEVILSDQLNVKEDRARDDNSLGQTAEIVHRRVIRAKMRPGDTRSDESYFRRTTYTMFGTDRPVPQFSLDIYPLTPEADKEEVRAWGMVGYTDDSDLHRDEQPGYIGFSLMIKPSTFELYAQRIADGTADEIVLAVGIVSGFYSEWSPDISTRDVKVLATGKEQVVEIPVGTEFEPPRLGSVGEVNLYINAKRIHVAPKSDDNADDDRPAPVLTRPEMSDAKPAGVEPQTVALLGSLKGAARWIIGLLVVLILVMMTKH